MDRWKRGQDALGRLGVKSRLNLGSGHDRVGGLGGIVWDARRLGKTCTSVGVGVLALEDQVGDYGHLCFENLNL